MKTAVVLTTINIPHIVKDFCENFEKYGYADTEVIIIGDKKSPDEQSKKLVKEYADKGFKIFYYDIPAQEEWLKNFPKLAEIIPYNTDNRRNIGFLMAKERGAEMLISTDDDNFPLIDHDFVGSHLKMISQAGDYEITSSDNKWFNICDLMGNNKNETIFARGFPYRIRKKYDQAQIKKEKKAGIRIMLNQGLWEKDPDVDAITRIERNVQMTNLKGSAVLGLGTFSPINSQNTALHIDLLPAYYFVIMNTVIDGLKIDRYGDIWSGLFTKKVMDAMGVYASFGEPLVDHRRNDHNLFNDLKGELNGIIYTERISEFLENVQLQGSSASELYADLSNKLKDFVDGEASFGEDFKNYIKKLHYSQHIWLETLASFSSL